MQLFGRILSKINRFNGKRKSKFKPSILNFLIPVDRKTMARNQKWKSWLQDSNVKEVVIFMQWLQRKDVMDVKYANFDGIDKVKMEAAASALLLK